MIDLTTGQQTSITAGTPTRSRTTPTTFSASCFTGLAESFTYDTLNRLTSSTVSLNPTPLVSTFTFNAIGNLISKSDVSTYSYPAAAAAWRHQHLRRGDQRQPPPQPALGSAKPSPGNAKGNMTSGNGLTIAYTSFDMPATITRGTTSISFDHDPEYQRYPGLRRGRRPDGGQRLHRVAGGGVLAERFAGSGGIVQWSNYLIAGGRLALLWQILLLGMRMRIPESVFQ